MECDVKCQGDSIKIQLTFDGAPKYCHCENYNNAWIVVWKLNNFIDGLYMAVS